MICGPGMIHTHKERERVSECENNKYGSPTACLNDD
jgi:hypothetical protein